MISREEIYAAVMFCAAIGFAIAIGVPVWCILAGIGSYVALWYFKV